MNENNLGIFIASLTLVVTAALYVEGKFSQIQAILKDIKREIKTTCADRRSDDDDFMG